jgi:hypothetical protein
LEHTHVFQIRHLGVSGNSLLCTLPFLTQTCFFRLRHYKFHRMK